jgi:hypothetical protein
MRLLPASKPSQLPLPASSPWRLQETLPRTQHLYLEHFLLQHFFNMANRVRRSTAGRPAENFTFEDWPVKRRKIAIDGMILIIYNIN